MEGRIQAAMSQPGGGELPTSGSTTVSPFVVLSCTLLAVIVAVIPWGFIFPATIIGASFFVWSYRRPVVALSLIILAHFIILEKTEDVTVPEIIFGVYLFGFLAWWFFNRMFIGYGRVCVHPADWFLMGYLLYAFLSVIPALAGGSELLSWFREYLTVATLFLYFPLREEMTIDRRRKILVGVMAVLICSIAVNNISNYGLKALAANYFWELLGARQAASAHFFFAAFVVLSAFVVHLRNTRQRLGVFILWLLVFVALLLTFARGFWFGSVAGVFAVFLASPVRIRKRILIYGTLFIVVGFTAAYLTTGDFAGRLIESLFERLTSSGKSLADVSLRGRFVESQAIIGPIMSSPVIGNGYGAMFSYFNIVSGYTFSSMYAHNGYLFLLFKVGIIGSLLFMAFFITIALTAWRESKTGHENIFHIALTRGTLGMLSGFLLITISSNVFIEKESLLVISVLGASVVSSVSKYRIAPSESPR